MEIPAPTNRIVTLRELTCQSPMMAELPSHTWGPRRELDLYEGWVAAVGQPTTRLRRAASRAYRMDHSPPIIGDCELIVGRPDLSPLSESEQERLAELGAMAQQFMPHPRGIYDHMAPDYPKLIRVGVDGLIAEVQERRRGLNRQLPESVAKDEFYCGCLMELSALLDLARRYSEAARAMASETTGERAAELCEIAEVLTKVPAGPAETFREALQSIHFYTFMLWGDYQMGRPDRYLIDLYGADVAAGRLAATGALELIDCFCLLYSTYHPKGSAVGFMLGGRDDAGRAVHNELTYLFLQSIAHTRMAYPGIGLCVHSETPDDLLETAAELLAAGHSHPAIFNDDAITQGLMDLGLPRSDACDYVHSSCVEITPCGRSGCWVFSPTINAPAILLDVMARSAECAGVEALLTAYERELRARVVAGVEAQKLWQLERSRNGTDSLLSSCLVEDCLARGKSVDEGGAKYNFIMPTFLGLANVVDSIAAIEVLVFDLGELTMADFHRVVVEDFAGNEALRQRIINRLHHFGNDEPVTDGLMRRVSEMIVRSCEGIVNLFGDRAVPGAYSYLDHVTFGKTTPATPDGRKAYTPLSAASSPVQGRDVSGATASILSSTCWDQRPFMGGVAINFRFQPLGAPTRDGIKAVIHTAIARGGLQLQINCVSRETLLDARENPQDHRDLVVRIGGYSDFFVLLSPEMQDEIVRRTAHE